MGCLCDKNKKSKNIKEDELKKGYSWEQRERNINPNDYTLDNCENTEVWKLPGSINGQQFIIRNCKNTSVYLLDHTNTLTIDDCTNCKFIIGPVKGSLFLRDCNDCICLAACGQYRMRDCLNVTVFLCCPTQPIIESSQRVHFGCFQLYYSQLEEQFKCAGLSLFNNIWNNVHDFTPTHGETNWCVLPSTMTVSDYLPRPVHELIDISLDKKLSVVPLTAGLYPETSDDLEVCLVVFFHNSQEESLSKSFINRFLEDRPSCWLVSCRQLTLEPRDAEVVFGSPVYNRLVQNGPLVGLVCAGPRVIYSCSKTVEKLGQSQSQVYVSTNPRTSTIQAETFTSVAAMLLSS